MIEAAARLFDPWALLLVAGGTTIAAALTATREDLRRALLALGPLVRARPAMDALVCARALGDIERVAEAKGVGCADHVHTECRFIRKAALRLADAPSAEAFARWARDELDERALRHHEALGVWRAAADSAPAMGMLGTVLGLIAMFARMDDPDAIGSAMALAMMTTFYGLLLSGLVAGPIAARLERLSAAELHWQRRAVGRLEALARADPAAARDWIRQRLRVVE